MYKKDDDFRHLYVADFETTVYDDKMTAKYGEQTRTEVWSAACCPVMKRPEPDDVIVYNNIYQFIQWLSTIPDNSIVFFHNLKFDGSFILVELDRENFVPAYSMKRPDHYAGNEELKLGMFSYTVLISDLGQWYSIKIRFEDRTIELWDSSKKIPSTLERMGKDFDTKYRKLEMKYEGERKPFGVITDEELAYIKNDILVLSEAMFIVYYEYNMQGMTIASDALKIYKEMIGEEQFKKWFPDLLKITLPISVTETHLDSFGQLYEETHLMTVYEYCQKGYSGGWCNMNPICKGGKVFINKDYIGKEMPYTYEDVDEHGNKVNVTVTKSVDEFCEDSDKTIIVKNMVHADVTSLYPSMMHSVSGNEYPVGKPKYHTGEPTEKQTKKFAIYRRFKCNFRIKEGYLPFVHIRGTSWYNSHENLETSYLKNHTPEETKREYVMCQAEFELFQKHYDIEDYEPLDYLTFEKAKGIFDSYIDRFIQMKNEATIEGNKAKRTIAKLYLNSLYGKLSSSTCSSYKTVYIEDETLRFDTHIEYEKQPIAISTGAYITAFARRFTITAAQANYYPGEYRGFAYSDTDSIALLDYNEEDIKGMVIHKAKLCTWKLEVSKMALFSVAKQKTYLEFILEEDGDKLVIDKNGKESYTINIKAAGLSDNGKNTFIKALMKEPEEGYCRAYVNIFKEGYCIKNCNLKAKQVKGGVLLVKRDYKMN